MYQQLKWDLAKRSDGIFSGPVRLIASRSDEDRRTRYFSVDLDLEAKQLSLQDEGEEEILVAVRQETLPVQEAPFMERWAYRLLEQLVTCYEPIAPHLPVGIETGGVESTPVEADEAELLWAIAEDIPESVIDIYSPSPIVSLD